MLQRDAKETPNAGLEVLRPGRVGPRRNPGGASRVASAGLRRAHEVHVGVGEPACRASFLQRRSGQVPALAERRAGRLPRAPARHPAGRRGAGTAPRPGAWRRSPRAALLGCLGLLLAAVREARRLCPGMAGGAGAVGRGFPTGQTLAWGVAGWAGAGGSAVELQGGCASSRAPETGAGDRRGPAGSTWVDPKPRASVGVTGRRRVNSPKPAHEQGTGTWSSSSSCGIGRESARGREGGGRVRGGGGDATEVWPRGRPREALRGCGPAPSAAPQSAPGAEEAEWAATCPPVAPRSLPAFTYPRHERKREGVSSEAARAGWFQPAGRAPARARGRCGATPGVLMRGGDRELGGAAPWVELPRARPERARVFKAGISRSGPQTRRSALPRPPHPPLPHPRRRVPQALRTASFMWM